MQIQLQIRKYVSDELRSLRARENKSREQVSEELKISKDTLVRYENGTVAINIDTLEKILKYYDVPIDIFFTNVCANKHKKEE